MVEAIAAGDEMGSYEAHYAHVMNARERLTASLVSGG
jgi:hypothetical protein